MKKPIYQKLLLPLFVLLFLLSGCSFGTALDNTLEVHFIDVGQADATLLLCNGQSMLIDGGNVDDSSLMAAYLKKQGIRHLNYVIGTHAHEDHIGGLAGVLSLCTADTVYVPETTMDSKAYQNFIKKAEAGADTIVTPKPGDEIRLGDATIRFLGPIQEDASNVNSTSICCKVVYGETSFLFTGDAEADAEKRMVEAGYDLSATVLKAPHHGSESSSSYIFLRQVLPQYVVIQVGKDNSYGHPHSEPMSRYRDVDAQVYRTDLQGDVICTSDGKRVTFHVSKNENAITNPTTADGSGQNSQKITYIGNRKSKVFHLPTCSNLPDEGNQVTFDNRQQAVVEGYRACGNCEP